MSKSKLALVPGLTMNRTPSPHPSPLEAGERGGVRGKIWLGYAALRLYVF